MLGKIYLLLDFRQKPQLRTQMIFFLPGVVSSTTFCCLCLRGSTDGLVELDLVLHERDREREILAV